MIGTAEFHALTLTPDDKTPLGVDGDALIAWAVEEAAADICDMRKHGDYKLLPAYLSAAYHVGFIIGWKLHAQS